MPEEEPRTDVRRRHFLGRAGTTALGIASAAAVSGKNNLTFAGPPPHSLQERKQVDEWIARLVKTGARKPNDKATHRYQPSIQNFADLIESDSLVRMYVNQMIEQVPDSKK